MVDRLTNLIAIFENPALDFSKNRAEGDDILGDAYEYLMRHFATESGKSKGQFYTPAEVSRIMAQIIGIRDAKTSAATTVYDPTCGSGSLLLKVGDEAGTAGHALRAGEGRRHQRPRPHEHDPAQQPDGARSCRATRWPIPSSRTATRSRPSTTSSPIRPSRDKRWSTGLDPLNDPYERFKPFGTPPAKQGDYAYLLHIVRSLKSTGKGACILPHGVLFRGNAEADIRRNLVRKGYIKGIIGLPANLFYGTGIPACIVVIDKEDAHARKGIFMIDASSGFMKDGPKNRLRAQDIHKIVDVFNKRLEVPKYSRMVAVRRRSRRTSSTSTCRATSTASSPRTCRTSRATCRAASPTAMSMRSSATGTSARSSGTPCSRKPTAPATVDLAVTKAAIKSTIYEHPEFATFIAGMNAHFAAWQKTSAATLKGFRPAAIPRRSSRRSPRTCSPTSPASRSSTPTTSIST